MEVIGRPLDAAVMEAVADALADAFGGRRKTFGQFDADGNAQPGTGLLLKGLHLDTVELGDPEIGEQAIILIFIFSYVRG